MTNLKKLFNQNALIGSFAALFLTASLAAAQVVRVDDARKPISPRAKTTYADLVKTVFPDAKAYQTIFAEQGKPNRIGYGVDAQRSIPLRNLFGRFDGIPFEGLMTIGNLSAVRLQTREGERLLLLMTVNPVYEIEASTVSGDDIFAGKKAPPTVEQKVEKPDETQKADDDRTRKADYLDVIALFRLAPQPELLDAADVRRDTEKVSFVYFSDIFPHLEIRARQDGFFIINEIARRDEKENSYLYSLLTASGERLQMLSGDALQIDSSDGCPSKSETTAYFTVGDERARNDYRPIKIETVAQNAAYAADCKTILSRSETTTVFDLIWNRTGSKYETRNASTRTKVAENASRKRAKKYQSKKN